jgi:hypothetical protein
MVVLEALQLDELEHLRHALSALLPAPARELERQADVLRHGAPVEEDGVLEHDPVVAVAPGLLGRLPVHERVARGRRDQVADHPQQRRLAAARRADQRHELAGYDLEVDPLQSGRAALEGLRDAADRHGRGGAQTRSLCS